MKLYNQHLDTLSKGQPKLLVFDCEFWRVMGSSGFIGIPDSDEFFIPREIGGFFLTKNTDFVYFPLIYTTQAVSESRESRRARFIF